METSPKDKLTVSDHLGLLGELCHPNSDGDEYLIYLQCADDGKGGDITRDGAPLKTFEEWMNS